MTTEDENQYDGGLQHVTTATTPIGNGTNDDQYSYNNYDYLNDSSFNYDYNYEGDYGGYEDYLYFGFQFERPIYMYFWPVLVFLATVANVLLIVILLKKNLRNSTNIVLIGIALAEMLTLLVTIPTYVLAYYKFDDGPGTDVYVLTKDWCNAFMICKFFLSKWFRTASVWLHCFLGFHRLMAIWRPFYFLHVLQIRWSIAVIIFLYACAPAPHIFRVLQSYANHGFCGWGVREDCSSPAGCKYRWVLLLAVDLVPCFLLGLFTILIVAKLCQSSEFLGSSEMLSKPHLTLRRTENKRSSILVTTIVLSLLIPEIPYVVFLTYMQVRQTHELFHERADREFHTAYEILIALSFTTNFFINLVLNNTFRSELTGLFRRCCRRIAPNTCECRLCRVKVTYDLDGYPDSPGPMSPTTQESNV